MNLFTIHQSNHPITMASGYGDDDVEISSNEFKNSMRTTDGRVAVDWIGHIGYMFAIIDINHVYYAQKIDIIIMPKIYCGFDSFRNDSGSPLLLSPFYRQQRTAQLDLVLENTEEDIYTGVLDNGYTFLCQMNYGL
ncbi:MAG: hypothetical protein EXX96DRAFT_617798 [Benjaminiella poitrasii]|nr:MAG: hypothetical protein EXX96DRAFT_617798 [Benjaminiella poitrasii]